jgi:Ca2+-binding EF-hand superfamily protein
VTKTGRLLLAGGTLALGAALFAGASVADGWGRHHGRGHHGGAVFLFEQFDANQDDRLTQAEIDQVRRGRLAEFDQNRDGSLTLEEYQALWMAAMRERMVDRFQEHDDDGDGLVTIEEFAEPFDRVILRFDRNGDGELTLDEVRRHGGRDRDDEHGDDGDRGQGDDQE